MSFENPSGGQELKFEERHSVEKPRPEQIAAIEKLPVSDYAKIGVVLALCGAKLGTEIEIESGEIFDMDEYETDNLDNELHKVMSARRKAVREELQGEKKLIEDCLQKIGLVVTERIDSEAYAVTQEGKRRTMLIERVVKFIGHKKEDVEELREIGNRPAKNIEEDRRRGRIYGFPQTAIEAFIAADGLSQEARKEILIGNANVPKEIESEEYDAFRSFMLSRAHWREEVETLKRWAAIVKEVSPELYKRRLEKHRKDLLPHPGTLAA